MKIVSSLVLFLCFIAIGLTYVSCTSKVDHHACQTQKHSGDIERTYVNPKRVVWVSNSDRVKNETQLLQEGNGQADLFNDKLCVLKNQGEEITSIVLDYGKELHGGLQIVTGRWPGNKPLNIRVRFGESVSETMAEIKGEENATNDHAIRDWTIQVPWLGKTEIGNSGYRFVRIDLLDEDASLYLKEVNAIDIKRDIPYLGSFKSNDERLNQIWETGAYTVHLNMQEYLWDGVKRDRLVWVGDMHPEVMTIFSVFGNNEVMPVTLDLIKGKTPVPQWMNGISSYSMWWLIIQEQFYLHTGDIDYLKKQKDYVYALLSHLATKIDKDGNEILDGKRFLDWPTSGNDKAIKAGLQSLMIITFESGVKIAEALNDAEKAIDYKEVISSLRQAKVDSNGSKSAAALMVWAGLEDSKAVNSEILVKNDVEGLSTFYGYYVLNAMAAAENYTGAMNFISKYWGGMLDLGATTFWEDFNINWTENAARIDEIVPEGKVDVHSAYGDYCYIGLRHSLCHGWASGPTAWLTEHVLGVKVLEPGCKKVSIKPNLGDLQWVEGTFPTPNGVIEIRHEKMSDGIIKSDIKAPKGIKIVK